MTALFNQVEERIPDVPVFPFPLIRQILEAKVTLDVEDDVEGFLERLDGADHLDQNHSFW